MYLKLLNKENKIAVIGLGYVGLPIALEFAKKISVIGFDINDKRIAMMNNGIDPSNELDASAFENCDIEFTSSLDVLRKAKFFIVAVPTPVDEHNVPDLKPVKNASATIGKVIKKGDYVVFESTVYPGCTEEDCLPIIEQISGLKAITDFKLGYSPERINPGDKEHRLENITKIVSGEDAETLEAVAALYSVVVEVGVYKASSIKVAEAAKVIENTQRDVNIALINELAVIFNLMNIDTLEVLEAAGTKWNFLPFRPGLVGGHCIGVDPYYLTHKVSTLGYTPEVILAGRRINDRMGSYIAQQTIKQMILAGTMSKGANVLVLGLTFKENCADIRNSKVIDIINELKDYGLNVIVWDPMADIHEAQKEYGLSLTDLSSIHQIDAVIAAVAHQQILSIDLDFIRSRSRIDGTPWIDVKSVFSVPSLYGFGFKVWRL